MEQTVNILLFITATGSLLGFGIFALYSYQEKEKRALRVSASIAIGSAGLFSLMTLLSLEVKVILLSLIGAGVLGILILSTLPIGKVKIGNDTPSKRFDEHDIMFARDRLHPGSANYQAYYAMHPENKATDDATRDKPGLLSPKAKLANEVLFASP